MNIKFFILYLFILPIALPVCAVAQQQYPPAGPRVGPVDTDMSKPGNFDRMGEAPEGSAERETHDRLEEHWREQGDQLEQPGTVTGQETVPVYIPGVGLIWVIADRVETVDLVPNPEAARSSGQNVAVQTGPGKAIMMLRRGVKKFLERVRVSFEPRALTNPPPGMPGWPLVECPPRSGDSSPTDGDGHSDGDSSGDSDKPDNGDSGSSTPDTGETDSDGSSDDASDSADDEQAGVPATAEFCDAVADLVEGQSVSGY